MTDDLLKSSLGAVVGFALAHVLNFAKMGWYFWRRPRIRVLANAYHILSHSTELANGDRAKEIIYGFRVKNTGRQMAIGVRFQMLNCAGYESKIRKQNVEKEGHYSWTFCIA